MGRSLGSETTSNRARNESMVRELSIETPHGPARAHLTLEADARAALLLGHGAGGGVQARDLVAAAGAGTARGLSVALVEQPYRVAGRRSPRRRGTWTPRGLPSCSISPYASSA